MLSEKVRKTPSVLPSSNHLCSWRHRRGKIDILTQILKTSEFWRNTVVRQWQLVPFEEHLSACEVTIAEYAGLDSAVDPSFSDYIWSPDTMTTSKKVVIPIYEMSAKEIEGYIKCFDANVQTWVVIVQADQVQGALKFQGVSLHRLDKVAMVRWESVGGK